MKNWQCMFISLLVQTLLLALSFQVAAQAQDTAAEKTETSRVPAQILPAERAGILLSPARDALEEPEKTLDALGLKDGDIVADIGCGNGYYSLRLAERIAPHGHVFAVDIQQGMLDQMIARMADAEIYNIYPILSSTTDPYLPPGKIDWVLLVDVYHEFSDPQPMLAKIKEALAPKGRVALLEYRAEQDPATIPFPIPRDHKMTVEEVMSEWTPAGFELAERLEFLPAQHLFIFRVAGEHAWHEDVPIRKLEVGETAKVSTLGGKIYFSGQPAEADLKTFAEFGVKTVINLRTQQEIEGLGFDEAALVKEAGMKYLNFPMGRELPAGDSLEAIFSAIDRAPGESILIHCASSNRVGAIWGAFSRTRLGLSADDAVARGKAAGMRAPAFEAGIRSLERSR